MGRECLNCGNLGMMHCGRDIQARLGAKSTFVRNIKGWHCPKCGDVEFDMGEGDRYVAALEALRGDPSTHLQLLSTVARS